MLRRHGVWIKMSLTGLLLGLINMGIVVAVLLLFGGVVMWVSGMLQFPVPWIIQRAYLTVVALIALYMLATLLFGGPSVHLIDGRM